MVKLPSSSTAQELIVCFLLKEDQISSSNYLDKMNIPEKMFMASHGKHLLILPEKVQNLDEIKSTSADQEEAKALLVCDKCTDLFAHLMIFTTVLVSSMVILSI